MFDREFKIKDFEKCCPCIVESPYSSEAQKLIEVALSRKIDSSWAVELATVVHDMCFTFRNIELTLPPNPDKVFAEFLIDSANLLQSRLKTIPKQTFPLPDQPTKDKKSITSDHYGELFSEFDKSTYFEEPKKLLAQRLERNQFDLDWFQGKKVLDSGCGNGRYSYALKSLGASQVIGIDLSEKNILDAKHRLSLRPLDGLSYQLANVSELPFEESSFDYVFSNGVLHHTDVLDKGLEELLRVLKPGGKGFLMLINKPGGIHWDFIEICRVLTKDIHHSFMHDFFKVMNIPPNLRFLYLDHIMVPINIRLSSQEISEKLKNSGAESIRRYERGADVDGQEKFSQYKASNIVWGCGLHRFEFAKS